MSEPKDSAQWIARGIIRGGLLDIPRDRTEFTGSKSNRPTLQAALVVHMPSVYEQIHDGLASGTIDPATAKLHTFHPAPDLTVAVDTKGSHGHLYIIVSLVTG